MRYWTGSLVLLQTALSIQPERLKTNRIILHLGNFFYRFKNLIALKTYKKPSCLMFVFHDEQQQFIFRSLQQKHGTIVKATEAALYGD